MAKASKIGSAVYKALPEDFRQFWMYRAFVGEALKMLKDQEMTGEQVLESLFRTYVEVWYLKAEEREAERREQERSAGSTERKKAVEINIRRKEYNETTRLSDFEAAPVNIFNKCTSNNSSQSGGMGPPSFLEISLLNLRDGWKSGPG
jgi:hypothetical protein